MKICTVEGCNEPYRASGYCKRHYDKWHRYGDPEHQPRHPRHPDECKVEGCDRVPIGRGQCSYHYYKDPSRGLCKVENCDKPVRTIKSGLCYAHLKRERRRGTTNAFPGDRGSIVERIDAQTEGTANGCINWTGRANTPAGYGRVRWGSKDPKTGRKKYHLVHRVAWMLWNDTDEIPEGMIVRHLCNNSMCVNPLHLGLGTMSENTKDSVRAGTHASMKLSRLVGQRVRAAAVRRGVDPAVIDAVIAECS